MLANIAIEQLKADKCIFIPVSDKYNRKQNFVSSEHRYNMLLESVKDEEKQEVSNIEIICDKQLTTYETLTILQNQYPDSKIVFVMGSDNLIDLKTWQNYEELLKKFRFAILKREQDNILNIIENDILLKKYSNHIYVLNVQKSILQYISSSIVRRFDNINIASIFLKENVKNYIVKNKLYYFKKK